MQIVCHDTGGKTGLIYIRFGDAAFPCEDWEDFYREILADWLDVVETCGEKSDFQLFFMDGPYYLQCHREWDHLVIHAVDGHDDSVVVTEKMSFLSLLAQLRQIKQTISSAGREAR